MILSSASNFQLAMSMTKRKRTEGFHPHGWENDDTMAGLMSMFKNRDVNPADYDAKLKFWTSAIIDACLHEHSAMVDLSELSYRFRRGDRVPAGLSTVLEHMISDGQSQTVEEFTEGSPGWVGWGVNTFLSKPVSWLLGYGSTDVSKLELVILPVVREQANKIVERHTESLEDDPYASSVVDLQSLRRGVKDICNTDRDLDLALIYLQKNNLITIGKSTQGDTIVKFKETQENGCTTLTQTDTNLHSLRTLAKKLEAEIMKLEQHATKLDQQARVHVREGNKIKAKSVLRQKLAILKKVKEKEASYSNIDSLMMKLAETKEQKEVLDAYRAGASAFKQTLKSHGISPDRVDETMDDIQEALGDYNDISMALAQGPSGNGGIGESDADLENELEQLLNDDSEKNLAPAQPEVEFPEVPTGIRDEPIDRLKQLRRQLEN